MGAGSFEEDPVADSGMGCIFRVSKRERGNGCGIRIVYVSVVLQVLCEWTARGFGTSLAGGSVYLSLSNVDTLSALSALCQWVAVPVRSIVLYAVYWSTAACHRHMDRRGPRSQPVMIAFSGCSLIQSRLRTHGFFAVECSCVCPEQGGDSYMSPDASMASGWDGVRGRVATTCLFVSVRSTPGALWWSRPLCLRSRIVGRSRCESPVGEDDPRDVL